MDEHYVITVGHEMFKTAAIVAAPAMIVGMLVGVLMAVFQAITSVQEQSLTMIPKIFAVGLTIALMLPWILKTLTVFSTQLFSALADAAW